MSQTQNHGNSGGSGDPPASSSIAGTSVCSTTTVSTIRTYERTVTTNSATGRSTASSRGNMISCVKTTRASESSAAEEGEPLPKKKAKESTEATTGIVTMSSSNDGTSLESMAHTTTHNLSDPASLNKMLENVLKPLVIYCGARENTRIAVDWQSTPKVAERPQLKLVLKLEAATKSEGTDSSVLRGSGDNRGWNTANAVEMVQTNKLENILFNGNASDVTLNITIRVDESGDISAAERDIRVAERMQAKRGVLEYTTTNDTLSAALIPYYLQYLYQPKEQPIEADRVVEVNDEDPDYIMDSGDEISSEDDITDEDE